MRALIKWKYLKKKEIHEKKKKVGEKKEEKNMSRVGESEIRHK